MKTSRKLSSRMKISNTKSWKFALSIDSERYCPPNTVQRLDRFPPLSRLYTAGTMQTMAGRSNGTPFGLGGSRKVPLQ